MTDGGLFWYVPISEITVVMLGIDLWRAAAQLAQ